MAKEMTKTTGGYASPFERIKRTNDAGMEFWSSRDFSGILGYGSQTRRISACIRKPLMWFFVDGKLKEALKLN